MTKQCLCGRDAGEPVAWMWQNANCRWVVSLNEPAIVAGARNITPLYALPAAPGGSSTWTEVVKLMEARGCEPV